MRVLLLLVIAIVLVEAVTGVGSAATGLAEKAIIVLVAAALVAVLPRVWRLSATVPLRLSGDRRAAAVRVGVRG